MSYMVLMPGTKVYHKEYNKNLIVMATIEKGESYYCVDPNTTIINNKCMSYTCMVNDLEEGWRDGTDIIVWNNFKKVKPTKSGYYQCTVLILNCTKEVIDLYWNNDKEKWIDSRVQNVFNTYAVYGYSKETGNQDERLYSDPLMGTAIKVLAWKLPPAPYDK